MLVTFLARLAREGSGQREMEKEEVEEAKVSWREGDIAHGVGTVAGSRRDVASGNDVDGRLSLSSANNIQHRPVYTHPITSTKLSPCAQATVEKRLVYEERDGSRARARVRVCVRVSLLVCLRAEAAMCCVVHGHNRPCATSTKESFCTRLDVSFTVSLYLHSVNGGWLRITREKYADRIKSIRDSSPVCVFSPLPEQR